MCFCLVVFGHPSAKCIALGNFGFGGGNALDAAHALATLGVNLTHLVDRMMYTTMVAVSGLGHENYSGKPSNIDNIRLHRAWLVAIPELDAAGRTPRTSASTESVVENRVIKINTLYRWPRLYIAAVDLTIINSHEAARVPPERLFRIDRREALLPNAQRRAKMPFQP